MNAASTITVLEIAAGVVAAAAAVRGTWSPCGLSMLSTLTPLGERARGRSYRAACAWFIAGAMVGGASLGAVAAAAALVVGIFHPSPATVAVTAAAAGLLVLLSDWGLVPFSLPNHQRQVNERWLDHYRTWVYGAGFGWQIGTGLVTYITSAATYLLVVAAVLTGRPEVALAVGIGFGTVRGLGVLLSARVRTSADLMSLHRRVESFAPIAHSAVLVAELLLIVGVLVTVGDVPPLVGAVAGLVVGVVLVSTTLAGRNRVVRRVDVA